MLVDVYFREQPEVPELLTLPLTSKSPLSWWMFEVPNNGETFWQMRMDESFLPYFQDVLLWEDIPDEWKSLAGTPVFSILPEYSTVEAS